MSERVIVRKTLSNRPSRTYDGLVHRYNERLQTVYQLPKDFNPEPVPYAQREEFLDRLVSYAIRIGDRLEKLGEDSIETYILPHPLLGKLTLKEFGYFTIYHCRHHLGLINKYSTS